MSQVIKAQNGTKTPEAKKSKHDNRYGHYIVDGVTYDVNDDFLRDYANSAKQYNDNSTSILANDILNTLRSGKDVSINTLNNSISGVDNYSFDNKDITKSQELNQAGWTRKTQRIARRNANRNSSLHQFHQGIQNLGNIRFTDPVEESQTPTQNQSLPTLFSTRNLDYDQDEKGNWIWSTGPQNAGNLQAINNIWRFLDASDEDAAKMYDTSGYETNVSDLRAWRDTNKNFDRNAFIERIKTNQLTNADWDLLSSMGFNRFDFSQGQDQASQQVSVPRSPEGSGFDNDALTRAGFYIQQGNDGNYYLLNSDGSIYNTPWYLRDEDLFKDTQWEGGSIVGGRLYTQDQTFNQDTDASRTIQALINAQGGEGTPEEIFQAMKNTGIRFSGSNLEHSPYIESFNRDKNTLKGFDDVFLDGDYYIRDLTASYNIPQNYNGLTVLSYLNRNNGRDYDQRLREQYAIYDPNNQGQYQRLFNNIEDLQSYLSNLGVTNQTGIQTPHRLDIQNYILHPEDGRRLIQSDDERSVTVGEGDQAMTFDIYRDDLGNYYARGLNNNIITLKGKAILEKIKNGTVTHQEMLQGFANEDQKSLAGNILNWEWLFGRKNPRRNYDAYESGSYDNYFRFKNGGKIPILQYGGKTLTAQSIIDRDEESKDRVGQASKAFGAQKAVKTSADKQAEAAGIVDGLSALATFAPGIGNAVGFIGGLAGSALRFASDVSRDGLDKNDVRRLAGNIGLDLLTLVPIIGTGARSAKIAKAAGKLANGPKLLKNASKLVTKTLPEGVRRASPVLSTTGIVGGGITAAQALNSEEPMTSDQFAQFSAGITGSLMGLRGLNRNWKAAQTAAKLSKPADKIPDKFTKTTVAEDAKLGEKAKNAAKNAAKTMGNTGNRWFKGIKNWNSQTARTLGYTFAPGQRDKAFVQILKNPDLEISKLDKKQIDALGEYLNRTGSVITNGVTYTGDRTSNFWGRNKFTASKESKSKTSRLVKPKLSSEQIVSGRQALQNNPVEFLSERLMSTVPNTNRDYLSMKAHYKPSITPVQVDNSLLGNRKYYSWGSEGEKKALLDKLNSLITPETVINQHLKIFRKGGKIVKAKPGTRLPIGYVSNNNDNGISGFPSTIGMVWQYPQGKSSNMSWYTTNLNGDSTPYAPSYHFMSQLQNFNDAPSEAVSKPQAKTRTANTPIPTLNGGTLDATTVTADKLALPTFSPYATTQMSQTTLDIPTVVQTGNPNPVVDTDSSETKSKETGIQTGEKSQWLSNLKINPDDLIAATELARSITANNRMFRDLQDANKAIYKDMPTEIYDRYQDHITPIYNEMAQRQRSYIPVSTDQLTNYAIRQSRQDAADQMEAEGKLKASEAYSQYLANDLAARRAYAEDRRNTAFYNKQMAANKNMRDAEIDQMRRLANNQSISNAVMEFRNKLNLDRNKKEAFMQQRDAIQAKNKYDEVFNNALSEWITKWNNDSNKANYASAEEYWMDKNMASYTDAITKARNAGLMTNQNNWNNYMWYHRINPIDLNASIPVTMTASRSYKSGGKTSAQYTRRHYGPKPDEAIWIQHNKATAEAIKQLRDSVIKLFMLNLK